MGQYLRKNGTTILLGIGLVVIIVNPDAKSRVMRQLMVTGIFNAQMDSNKFLEKENYALPFFSTAGKIPDVIYTGTLPTTVVLDKTRKIRYRHEGFANYDSEKFINQMENLVKE